MLQSVKQLYGHKLGATDGDIGHVKDFYFNDQSWVVRYAIAETGSWLSERRVLLSPHSFGSLHQTEKLLLINLTRKQIEGSPSVDLHKPVSRQYEEEYHRYYGWPYYWEGSGLWGDGNLPIIPIPTMPPVNPATAVGILPAPADVHLRSMQAVEGYNIQASDGLIGHVCDFMIDPKSWAIKELMIKTGNRFTGKEVYIPTSKVNRISYGTSTIFVTMTMADIKESPTEAVVTIA